MDHLPLSGREPPIVVPYLLPDDFAYDGGDLDSYPERQGWDFSAWRKNDRTYRDIDIKEWLQNSTRTKEKLPELLQAWLFFGQLSFALDRVVPVDDFTRLLEDDHSRVLTTVKLETYLADFASRFPDPTTDEEMKRAWAERRKFKNRFWASMSSLAIIFETLKGTISHGDPQIHDDLEKIQFVAGLLSDLLCSFMRLVFQIPGEQSPRNSDLGFGRSRLVIRNMRANGWCLHTMNRISMICPYTMQAYIYALGTCRTTQDHSRCTTGYCYANQAGTDFEAQHLGCTSADCGNLKTPIDEIVKVLQEGHIPLLEVQFKGKEYRDPYLVVRKADGKTPYVAISHVWADGLGNSKANSIPICQFNGLLRSLQEIQYIKSVLEKMEAKEDGLMMPFWLDTLCIPVEDQYQNLRDFSIQKMHGIYQQAHCALVLDPDFARMTKRRTPLHEILCRVLLSGWITRLWTYQEATLPTILYIRVKDGIIDLHSTYNRYYQRHNEDWIRARPVADTLVLHGISLLWALMPREQDRNGPDMDYAINPELYIDDLLQSITWRVTSRPGDETVCFATTLGFDPGPILKIKPPKMHRIDSREVYKETQLRFQEKRMIAFLKLLPTIPLSILFSSGPRISSMEGYRWAPRTLMQPETNFFGPSLRTRHRSDHYAYLHPKEKGVVAFVPSISIPRIDFRKTRWQIICKDGTSFRAGNLFDEATGSNEEQKNVVILLPEIIEGTKESRGLMVKPLGYEIWDPKAPTFSFKTIAAAHIIGNVFVKRNNFGSSSSYGTDYVATGASVKSKRWLLETL